MCRWQYLFVTCVRYRRKHWFITCVRCRGSTGLLPVWGAGGSTGLLPVWGAGGSTGLLPVWGAGAALVYYLCEVQRAALVYYLCEVQGAALVCSVAKTRIRCRCWRATWSRSLRTELTSCALRLRSELPYYCCQGDCVVTSLYCVYSAVWWRLTTVIIRDCCVDCSCGYHFCFYCNWTKWWLLITFPREFIYTGLMVCSHCPTKRPIQRPKKNGSVSVSVLVSGSVNAP